MKLPPLSCLILLSILHHSKGLDLSVSDPSGHVSVAFKEGQWKVYPTLIDWDVDYSVIARANFTNAQNSTGWMMLEVQTRESAPDQMQAQAAGIAEGYLTRISIIESYKEFYANDICAEKPMLCQFAEETFKANKLFVDANITQYFQTDPYWHQVNLYYLQMAGMTQGYQLKAQLEPRPEDEGMDHELGIMKLNFIADFWDLIEQFKLLNGTSESMEKPSKPSCTVLIKFLEEKRDILFGHNTWHEYRAMSYRILKNYNLNVHVLPDSSDRIPGHTIAMSSYAGSIASLDDFYLTSAYLATTETTLFLWNKELYRHLKPEKVVYEPVRVMVANRLSQFGSQWARYFEQHNSGTYNNMWMVVDYKKLDEEEIPTEGVLTVLEQLPHMVVIHDETKTLLTQGYWKSYNRAYYPETYQLSGQSEKFEKYGKWFSYNETARSKIIDRDQYKIQDMKTFMDFMRYNDFENDEFAQIQGCTHPNPAGSIANRLDLADPEMKCDFDDHDWMVQHSGYGALDAKIASKYSWPSLNFTAQAGPTHDRHPPFSWSSTNIPDKTPDFLPIDTFDFEPIEQEWIMNDGSVLKTAWLVMVITQVMNVNLVY